MRWKRVMAVVLAGAVIATSAVPANLLAASVNETSAAGEETESGTETADVQVQTEEAESTKETESTEMTEAETFPETQSVEETEEMTEAETEAAETKEETVETAERRSSRAEEDGLIASYSFEEDLSNDGDEADSAEAKIKGLGAYSGTVSYDENGVDGKALKLSGYGLQLNQKNVGTQYTVSAWFKPDSTFTENQNVMFLGYHDPEKWVAVAGNKNNSSEFKAWCNDSTTYKWATMKTLNLPVNDWSLLTISGNGEEVKTYLNGELISTASAPAALDGASQDIYIGVTNWDTPFSGLVDEVKVYNTVLTDEEVYDAYDTRSAEEVLAEEGITATADLSMKEGAKKTIAVTLPYKVQLSEYQVSYSSADETIATVDENGVVRGKAEGTTSVTTTVTLGSVSQTAVTNITIEQTDIPIIEEYTVSYTMKTNTEGTKLVDMSGHGHDATIVNPGGVEFTTEDDETIMTIKNQSSYVTLPQSIIEDLDNSEKFTIEAEYARSADCGQNSWLWSIGSNVKSTGTNYLFYCPAFGGSGGPVRSGIKNASSEKLLTLSQVNKDEEFYTATMVFDQGEISLYLDGVLIGTLSSGYSIVDDVIKNGCSEDILGFIGRSCWSGDTNFLGSLKSFKICNSAMTQEEVQEENSEKYTAILQKKLDEAVTQAGILGTKNEDVGHVKYNLVLPSKLEGHTIDWTSSEATVIEADGTVYNPENELEVTVTASITVGTLYASKEFTLKVLPIDLEKLTGLLETAGKIKGTYYTEYSYQKLQEAITTAQDVKNQEEADTAYRKLEKAIGNLTYLEAYVNPWDIIAKAAPVTRKTMKEGESAKLFELPEEVKDMVEVSYLTSDSAGAEYANGTVKAKKVGKVTATVIVKAKYNNWVMEYSTALDIQAKQTGETEKPNETDKPTETDKPKETEKPVTTVTVEKVSSVTSTSATTSIKLTWRKQTGVAGYEVYRYNASTKKYEKIATVTSNTYTDKSRKAATGYLYKIRSYKKVSNKLYYGEYSDVYKVLTTPKKTTAVKIKRTTKVSKATKATLTFKTVTRATDYYIYKYNKKSKSYKVAYKVTGKKLYQYNSTTKKYKKLRKVTVKKGIVTCKLTKLNLKKDKTQKYIIKAAVRKSGYTTQYSSKSKAVKLK